MTISTKRVMFLGSVPMALDELAMAPALLSAYVRRRGHDFTMLDINLELFELCHRNHEIYNCQIELLHNPSLPEQHNDLIDTWQNLIVSYVKSQHMILLNVFSIYSQTTALRLLKLIRQQLPHTIIIMGGIGSHKPLLGGINEQMADCVDLSFQKTSSAIFGELCRANGLVDDWQSDQSLSCLETWLPQKPLVTYNKSIDFSDYKIDQYDWGTLGPGVPMLGSHGCVRQCSFCDVIQHFPRYDFVAADELTKNIVDVWQQTKISRVQFMDSLVNGSMTNFLQLLKNLAHSREQGWLPPNFSWSGTYICRPPSHLLQDIHDALAPSGVDTLIVGVETGSDRVRYEMQKKFRNQDLLAEISAFDRVGIKAGAMFFPSWPTETENDFAQTLTLFDDLSRYGQSGTLDHVYLGTSGFILTDGTEIDQIKHTIGLKKGPLPWLWTCDSNPSLTFWETVRRRLLMAAWCEMRGIYVRNETMFRQQLAINLELNRHVIQQYTGKIPTEIDYTKHLPKQAQHELRMTIINRGQHRTITRIMIDQNRYDFLCQPGRNEIKIDIVRELRNSLHIELDFVFNRGYQADYRCDDNADLYDATGMYLDNIWLDQRDITLWAWNQCVTAHWSSESTSHPHYDIYSNLRYITAGLRLSLTVPAYVPWHTHLFRCVDPCAANERQQVDQRLDRALTQFVTDS